MNRIGDIIREHRNNKNMTQEELGRQLFVSKQAVSKWETGRTLPDVETIRRLADILDIRPEQMLGGTLNEANKTRRQMTAVSVVGICLVAVLLAVIVCGMIVHRRAALEEAYAPRGRNVENPNAVVVTMTELLTVPEKYHGKLVRVIGVGNLENNNDCLYLSEGDYRHRTDQVLWLEWSKYAPTYELSFVYNGKYVVVEGLFDKNERGYRDGFRGALRRVTYYGVWDLEESFDKSLYCHSEQNDNGSYSFSVTDKRGNVLFAQDGIVHSPGVVVVNDSILSIRSGIGVTLAWCVYCDVEEGKTSSMFRSVLNTRGRCVIWLREEDGVYTAVAQDAFDPAIQYAECVLEDGTPVLGKVVLRCLWDEYDENRVRISYYVDGGQNQKEIMFSVA